MDGIQGAVLSVKLKYLEDWNNSRIKNAEYYSNILKDIPGVSLPYCQKSNKHIYHIYPIMIKSRDNVLKELKSADIHCGIHYPVPIHLQNAFRNRLKNEKRFPLAEKCSKEELSLPMFPELSNTQMDYVAETLGRIMK